ncbi:MAG TPA: translation initiation factor IF-2 [Thermoanaerobaculia bacterium]|nr:translation initiation factor IF-2 [Thermoanaerobaculia bacterium]
MKTSTAKFTVSELARMMGKPAKEVLFLLQGIGVDVKSVESVLDPSTAQAILTGRTQAPKSLIVRQTPIVGEDKGAKAKTERAALKRIKIVEKPPDSEEGVGEGAAALAGTTTATATAPAAGADEATEVDAPAVAPPPPPPAPHPAPSAAHPAPHAAAPHAATSHAAASHAGAHAAPHAAPRVVKATVSEGEAPLGVVAPPPSSSPSSAPSASASAMTVTADPPRRAAHSPAFAPKTPAAPARSAASARPSPSGALGRILKRTGELPPLRTSLGANAAQPAAPSSNEASASPSGAPQAPVHHPRPVPPPSGGAPPPLRGAGGLGRAVIAPPNPAMTRSLRAATAPPAPMARPMTPQRPMPGRPGGSPGMAPRPGMSRGPMGPSLLPPSPPPLTTDKRRKDAGKPGTAVKKDDVKKAASKKPRTKEASALEEDVREYLGSYTPDTYDDVTTPVVELGEDGLPVVKVLSKSAQRRADKKLVEGDAGNVVEVKKNAPTGPVFLSEGVTVKELSDKTGILAKDLMKSFLARGIFATINQPIEPKVAVEIAKEFGIDAAIVSFEEELELARQQEFADQASVVPAPGAAETKAAAGDRVPRAPVVTVMGHVDHGKTSLLDAIRKANVAEGEAGGITQHIGAYRVEANGKKIVFLDTPGHEAFTMMRARGAKATDIVVLVVAADDGVMPQTLEAIDHARAAKVPMVVAINKIDKPDANVLRVKQELAERGVLIEEFGGEVVACEISAKKRVGIDQLLEMILLQADILELKAVATGPARGVVLEARKEVGRGSLATVLVQQGTLLVGDVFFAGAAVGRVRAMLDDHGRRIEAAGPATPVEVMGFEELPDAGDTLQVVEDEQKARQVSTFRVQKERDESLAKSSRMSLDSLFSRMNQGESKDLPLILKADVHGSEEVLVQSLGKLSTDKVKVSVLHSGVGAISVNDVLLASASEAIIIGFNVRPEKKAQELADKEGVDIRLYTVIYTLTDEMKKAMTGLLDTVKKEVARGKAEVRETFKVPKIGTIGGCMVTEGVIPRTASARLVRDGRVIYEGKIGSLRRFKDDVSEVKNGFECGIGIAGYPDLKVGDVIEAFVVEEVAPSLS